MTRIANAIRIATGHFIENLSPVPPQLIALATASVLNYSRATAAPSRHANEHVEAILEIMRKAARTRQAGLHAFTWLLTPLDPNTRLEGGKEKNS